MRKIAFVISWWFVGLAVVLWCPASSADSKAWPEVSTLNQSIYFGKGAPYAAGTYIFGADGNPAYLIECHDNTYEEDKGFLYSGDFECRLTALYEKASSARCSRMIPIRAGIGKVEGDFMQKN
ncbi:MAG: hypothetical protein ACRERU_10885 [Methylococcales bacterium]